MRDLLDRIASTAGCRVLPMAGLPAVEAGHVLPADLEDFYTLCGGAEFFVSGRLTECPATVP
jgi:antitoxin YokJ